MAERDFKAATDPCSFCGEYASRRTAMVCTSWSTTRICDICLGLCCAILADEVGDKLEDVSSTVLPVATLESILSRLPPPGTQPEANKARSSPIKFECSFCAAPRADVAKLVAGPRVMICESCIAAAVRFTQR